MTIDRAAAMRGLWDQAVELAEGLQPGDWQRPVPWTPAWSVGDLVSHLGGLQSLFNGAPQPPEPEGWTAPADGNPFDAAMAGPIAARSRWAPEQRLEELTTAADAHVAALADSTDWLEATAGPVGQTTKDGLFRTRAFDVWVHLQDLRLALDLPVAVDDPSDGAAVAHEYVVGLLPWMFVKRAGARDGNALRITLGPPTNHDNVLHVVGGRATWDPTADPGDCVITGAGGVLTLLTAGRGTPEHWRDAGALSWAGARGDDFVERARMF